MLKSRGEPAPCTGRAVVRPRTSFPWSPSATYKVSDRFSIYTNVLNVLDLKAPFDPSAAYSQGQFNPAWSGANILGRFIRVGARVDF